MVEDEAVAERRRQAYGERAGWCPAIRLACLFEDRFGGLDICDGDRGGHQAWQRSCRRDAEAVPQMGRRGEMQRAAVVLCAMLAGLYARSRPAVRA